MRKDELKIEVGEKAKVFKETGEFKMFKEIKAKKTPCCRDEARFNEKNSPDHFSMS